MNILEEVPEEESERSHHPLQNPVILKELFLFLPVDDLKRARLVCKQWEELSLPRWRSLACIQIGMRIRPTPKFQRLPQYAYSTTPFVTICKPHIPLENLVALYVPPIALKPFRKYQVNFWTFTQTSTPSWAPNLPSIFNEFWIKCGTWMQSLQLFRAKIDCVRVFKSLIFQKTPNLQELILFRVYDTGYCGCLGNGDEEEDFPPQENLKILKVSKGTCALPVTFEELFTHFPRIEKFILEGVASAQESTNLLTVLDNLKSRGYLKSLDLSEFEPMGETEAITSLTPLSRLPNLKLTSLSIDWELYPKEGQLQAVLETQRDTLQKLRCIRSPNTAPYAAFPFDIHFDTLTELHLCGHVSGSMDFLRFTPNLKALSVMQSEFETNKKYKLALSPDYVVDVMGGTDMSKFENVVVPSVQALSFVVTNPDLVTETVVRTLMGWMPNVKNLRMQLDNKAFREVCRGWKDLTELRIHSRGIDDHGITGEVDGNEECFPNITDLTELRKFSMEEYSDVSKLKNDSVHAFLKMPRLQQLSVSLSEDVTDDTFLALLRKFPSRDIRRDIKWPHDPRKVQNVEDVLTILGIA